MRKPLAALLFLLAFHFGSIAQQRPRYQIDATLNDRSRTLDGVLKVKFTNNTSDSVAYLWFNLYPNAFKSDRSAFSEYLIDKGRTDFYFSDQNKRGYINRLNFRVGDQILKVEDHPLYIDVVKVILASPLAPSDSVVITTPFHVKVPYNFNGVGYSDGTYILRYWYPAIADTVMPYTSTDKSSNVVADYDVSLTLPSRLTKTLYPKSERKISDSTSVLYFSDESIKDFELGINLKEVNLFQEPNLHNKVVYRIEKLAQRRFLPAVGYNKYDGLQLGILTDNFYKENRLHYLVAPLYTFNSKSVAGTAVVSYIVPLHKYFTNVELGATASTFSYNDGSDSVGNKVFAKLFKVVPYIKASLPTRSNKIQKTLSFKTFILTERDLNFTKYSVDSLFYPTKGNFETRFVNELSFDYTSVRVLYPYSAQLQVQQGINWIRFNATGNYFFNYPKGGGMNVRVFASKFGYIGNLSSSEKFATTRFQPKLTAVRGAEDFTYSNYFAGRAEFDGFSSHQIMIRDGGLKLRTDLFEGSQGRSDNWIASVNLNTSIPKIFPVNVPIKVFFDAGTYAEAWKNENPGPRFLFVSGLQISLFKNVVNIYAPLLYSKQYRDLFKSVPEENKFFKKVSFSINFERVVKSLTSLSKDSM